MRACRGRIWALLYLSACASSRGARRRLFKALYFVKQGTPKARSLTWQSCSRRPRTCRSSPTCAPRRPGGPDQGCRGRPRSTPRVSTPPLPLSPLPPPRFLPGSRLGSLCAWAFRALPAHESRFCAPSVLGSHSSLVGENETPRTVVHRWCSSSQWISDPNRGNERCSRHRTEQLSLRR